MTQKLIDKLKEVKALLEEEMPKECTAVTVFFNYQSIDVNTSNRTAEDLEKDDVTMRNLKGEWIH
jgi:hypothetical protein